MVILKNFYISDYYKYLLYLAGVLLIFSFSIEVKIISNLKLMILSLLTIFYGVSCWIYEGNMKTRCDNINVAWQLELSKPINSIKEFLNNEDPHKEFNEKYNPIKLSRIYERTRLIMFFAYLILLGGAIFFIK